MNDPDVRRQLLRLEQISQLFHGIGPHVQILDQVNQEKTQVEITEINEQYLFEFMEALQACINQLSADGVSISYVPSKSRELSRYMADTLDGEWKKTRGMEIQSVAIASVSYDDQSRKLIQMRNQGAMLQDPSIREGYMQGAVARGMESAGKNPAGSAMGFMGMGMGMQAGGDALSAASHTNRSQMQGQAFRKTPDAGSAADSWICSCGHANTGKFCSECGKPRPATDSWTCSCGQVNTGKFCSECGKPRPAAVSWICSCGQENTGKFCSECGKPRP